MNELEISELQKKYQRQDFTPSSYKEWLERAEDQDDPYAKFFMLFLAAVSSQERGRNEYEKIGTLASKLEQMHEGINAESDIDNALNSMLKYIKENRRGVEIQNLSANPTVRTSARFKSATNFQDDNMRITNALESILIIRNNLFHGDKRAYDQNDIEIIRRCNSILGATLKLYDHHHANTRL